MGLIQAFTGAVGGTFADQWRDFLAPPPGLPPTAALFPAIAQGQNAGRGSNVHGSVNVISNGSKILVPQGYGLVIFGDGRVVNVAVEPGGYEFRIADPYARSVFAGDGIVDSLVKSAWERFIHGGQPASQHLAVFVNLKEIPNNKFGTQSEIYWDDRYLNAQVGALVRGTYTIRIADPILFITSFVPATYITPNGPIFDFTDVDNPAANQLFHEVVSSLSAAFSAYTNDPAQGNRISRIQQDAVGFAHALAGSVEQAFQWRARRGLEIVNTAIIAIEYDDDTAALLSDVKKADALSGSRGNSFLQQSVARGVEAAGESQGGAGLALFGMGAGAAGNVATGMQQNPTPTPGPFPPVPPQADTTPPQGSAPLPTPEFSSPAASEAPTHDDPVSWLTQVKAMLDQGLITQADYDAAKAKVLGL